MKTAKLLKEEISNPNIWKLLLIELGLKPDIDEVTVKAVSSKKSETMKRTALKSRIAKARQEEPNNE
jgi:hypothetical protein